MKRFSGSVHLEKLHIYAFQIYNKVIFLSSNKINKILTFQMQIVHTKSPEKIINGEELLM